jgi:hypothetical protein
MSVQDPLFPKAGPRLARFECPGFAGAPSADSTAGAAQENESRLIFTSKLIR